MHHNPINLPLPSPWTPVDRHTLEIFKISAAFWDLQVILLSFFDISYGFRFWNFCQSVSVLIYRSPCPVSAIRLAVKTTLNGWKGKRRTRTLQPIAPAETKVAMVDGWHHWQIWLAPWIITTRTKSNAKAGCRELFIWSGLIICKRSTKSNRILWLIDVTMQEFEGCPVDEQAKSMYTK